VVRARREQAVAFEDRPVIQEGDRDIVVQHDVGVDLSRRDRTENAAAGHRRGRLPVCEQREAEDLSEGFAA